MTENNPEVKPIIAQIEHKCLDCGDTFTAPDSPFNTSCPGGCRNPYLGCDACGDIFRPEQPPDDGQKVYEVHGCKQGKVLAQRDNPTCSHCGAPKAGITSPCSCPEDTAKRKAQAEANAKKDQIDKERWELDRLTRRREEAARFKAAGPMVDLAGLRKVAQRDRTDAELLDRERAVKDRELSRRERRQDGYDDDDEATEPTAGLTFASFGQAVTLLGVERMPSAFVR